MPVLLYLLLAAAAAAQTHTLAGPESVMAGAAVEFELRTEDGPVAGVELRVTAPAVTAGVVNTASLNLRTGPGSSHPAKGILYRNETVLVLAADPNDWCSIIAPNGGTGFVACQYLAQKPYGQPLGVTDDQGKLTAADLALVPGAVEVMAGALAAATVRVLPYEYDRREDGAPGIWYRERRFVRDADGPFTIEILEVDPADPRVNLLAVRARDRAIGRETVSSMARRYGATAGVNGGYFVVSGTYAGASTGVYQLNRQPLSGGTNRTALVFCEEQDFLERLEMGVVNFRGRATAAGATANVLGMNRQRSQQDMVVFLPLLGPSTLTDASGVEAVLDSESRVVRLEDGTGNAAIPPGGQVLSGAGAAAAWLRDHAQPGTAIALDLALNRAEPGCRAGDIVGAGPRLLRNGEIRVSQEGFSHAETRNPRTAAAVTERGTLLFVTLDGRQAASAGMRLDEFAAELKSLGAVEAMNLDGGGSTTMLVRQRIRNSPSDGSERAVSDAILVFSVGTLEELSALVERLGEDPAHITPSLLHSIRDKLAVGLLPELLAIIETNEGAGVSVTAARLLREAVHGVR